MPEEKRKFEQVDPGGDADEYEYADSKEVDAKAKEKKAKGQDDGDRLVGGKITSTRFGKGSFQSSEISLLTPAIIYYCGLQ